MLAVLIRHGETDANTQPRFLGGRSDPSLNARGREQARSLARFFADLPAAAVYASPLRRASETAAAVAEAVGRPVIAEPALREMDLGELEGLAVAEGWTRYPEMAAAWRRQPSRARMPGGETLREVQARAWARLTARAREHDGETVVFVTHTFVLLAVVGEVLGLPLDRFRRLYVDTGGVAVARLGGRRPSLVAMNVRPDGRWGARGFR